MKVLLLAITSLGLLWGCQKQDIKKQDEPNHNKKVEAKFETKSETGNKNIDKNKKSAKRKIPEDIKKIFDLVYKGKYISAIKLNDKSKEKIGFTQHFAFVGREPQQMYPDKTRKVRFCKDDIVKQLRSDPISEIIKQAKKHRIVIINEAHDQPRDRAFILKVVEALRPIGYDIYAAETLAIRGLSLEEWQSQLKKRGRPINFDGYYSRETVFNQLLERVIELDYKLVPYEKEKKVPDGEDPIRFRETSQAKNLIERALNKHPDSKIIIHVGYSHAREIPDNAGNIWMAKVLKDQTGIDPLTISQTRNKNAGCIVKNPKSKNALDYKYSLPNMGVNEPASYHGFDIQLFPGETKYYKGRPIWLKEIGRKFVDIPKSLHFDDKWVLLEARLVGETEPEFDLPAKETISASYIPVDKVLVRPGEDIALALPSGKYKIIALDENDKMVGNAIIEVK